MSKVSKIDTISLTSFFSTRDPELEDKYSTEYLSLMSILPKNLVKHHKGCLGKQDFCFSASRRYWVWRGENWCVYVNNDIGAQVEVDPQATVEEAWEIWVDYKDKLQEAGE